MKLADLKSAATQAMEKYPLHIVPAVVHPALAKIAGVAQITQPDEVWGPIIVLGIIAGILLPVLQLFVRDWRRAGLFVTAFIGWCFAYSFLVAIFMDLRRTAGFVGNEEALKPVFMVYTIIYLLIPIFAIRLLLKLNSSLLKDLTFVLNATMIGFFAWDGVAFFNSYQEYFAKSASIVAQNKLPSNFIANAKVTVRPDIYYIILDGMASEDSLKKRFQIDSDFIKSLEERGFYVAADSKSNFEFTVLSLSSSLNMRYPLERFADASTHNNWNLIMPIIENNQFVQALKMLGYKYILLDSSAASTRNSPLADQVRRAGPMYGFSDFSLLLHQSIWSLVEPSYPIFHNLLGGQRLWEFQELKNTVSEPSPKFVFAHINFPHYPYILDRNGKVLEDCSFSPLGVMWKEKDKYRDAALFAQKASLDAVDAILKNSKAPPIIIIQGDHGPDSGGRERVSPTTSEYVDERHSILNAYYLPADGKSELYSTISPVNSFRTVLRHYFHLDLPNLPDKQYFAAFPEICRVQDVTKLLKTPSSGDKAGSLER